VESPEKGRQLDLIKWGLIPSWAKKMSIGNKMINARSETVTEKPSFKTSIRKRRCLIPADGFYEWKKSKGKSNPYYIRMKEDEAFAFAGLWDAWKSPEDKIIETFTILTTSANDLLKPIHERMPVILHPEDYDLWLDPTVQDPSKAVPLLTAYPSDDMMTFPIGTFVNSPKNDGPECIQPLAVRLNLFR